jgi:hypothetical protein
MPVCEPGSLPGFVGIVTTVAGRGSPAEWTKRPSEIPYLVDSSPPTTSPGATSGPFLPRATKDSLQPAVPPRR